MSAASPQVFRVADIGRGYLAMMPHPASLGDPAAAFTALAARGVRQVVSLLRDDESERLGLGDEAGLAQASGIAFSRFPVTDMGAPRSVGGFAQLAGRLYRDVDAGRSTVIHCRAGVGRSGLLAAAVLMQDGRDARTAFAQVARRRGMPVPETSGQGEWLEANAAAIRAAGQGAA